MISDALKQEVGRKSSISIRDELMFDLFIMPFSSAGGEDVRRLAVKLRELLEIQIVYPFK